VPDSKRIVLVTNEVLGLIRNGGAGTANTFLAFALANLGHRVEVLYIAPASERDLDPSWAREYAKHGIRIRLLERGTGRVFPERLAVPYDVERMLRGDPPDVVIAHDQSGAAYGALRRRALGLGFADTLFVVYCHGTTQWIYDAHRKVRRSPASFELEAIERASAELADVVVSPSAYMLEWMRARGWRLPATLVAPYFTRTRIERDSSAPRRRGEIRRLAFFGRLEERKGLGPFVEALNRLPTDRLSGIELVFLGRETVLWPPARVREELSSRAKGALARLRFETDLDQPEALALLREPGTLAVMPSLVDNSPNVIYECLEHGIPFLAGNTGGGPELVAVADRAATFFTPTAEGIATALEEALAGERPPSPQRPAFDTDSLRAAWQDVVTSQPAAAVAGDSAPRVSAIVLDGDGPNVAALRKQTRPPDEMLLGGEADPQGDLVLLLRAVDELEPEALETLLRAIDASGADVVTCGVRTRTARAEEVHLFLGDARELGIIANHFGLVGLYRRDSFLAQRADMDVDDPDWLRLAQLALGGATIESVPTPLVRTTRTPGAAATDPIGSGTTLAVVEAYERASPAGLEGLPRLAAALAARRVGGVGRPPLGTRMRWVWENEGALGFARRLRAKATRLGGYPGRLSERARGSGRQSGHSEAAPKTG
jgi:glycosyltransferase involved in cell wall biosynthesis